MSGEFDSGDWGRVPAPSAKTVQRHIDSDVNGVCKVCGALPSWICDAVAHLQAAAEKKQIHEAGEVNWTRKLSMPSEVTVLVFASDAEPGTWFVKVNANAVDVATGKMDFFGSTVRVGAYPSPEDVATIVTNWLDHEVREQLGLKPHEGYP